MLRPPQSLLVGLVSTTVVVTIALGWGGWRLFEQQRALDEQRERDRAESAADAIAAGIRGKLAEAGERLSGWLSNPSSPVPAVDGAVVVASGPGLIEVNPPGSLPFVPVTGKTTLAPDTFDTLEAIEFGRDRPQRALPAYRAMTQSPELQVRAGALVRFGRMQRRTGDFAGALNTYQQLADPHRRLARGTGRARRSALHIPGDGT